ncbi:hypothetical protein Cma02nite_33990 [Cellulomonas marina]|uniref:Uncharacterized protein n=1 Tax=Cellulomonas marina TaxID=988821 RepID=A0A1I1B139_9CELL|nr:hypothetical protein Cma02nite_33990 [Cellulomonas marina]SFB42398.1 hypothetical protein SAMN05421867_1265 [Cellulomonas marina]
MQLAMSDLASERSVFFGAADSYSIIRLGSTEREIMHRMRLAVLLYDRVIVAAAHFWQSEQMRRILPQVKQLVEVGAVLPAIRAADETRDVNDYFARRLSQTSQLHNALRATDPAIESEIARPGQYHIARRIERLGAVVHLDFNSVEAEFRSIWLADCIDCQVLGSVNMLVTSRVSEPERGAIMRRLRSLALRSFFSRSEVARAARELALPTEFCRSLVARASHLYLLANAKSCASDLLAPSAPIEAAGTGPLALSNVLLLERVLELCGVPHGALRTMSLPELLQLRDAPEFVRFREFYLNTVKRSMEAHADWQQATLRRISAMRDSERRLASIMRQLYKVQHHSGQLFLVAASSEWIEPALPTGSLATAAAMGWGVPTVLNRIPWLQNRPTDDFYQFAVAQNFGKRLPRM